MVHVLLGHRLLVPVDSFLSLAVRFLFLNKSFLSEKEKITVLLLSKKKSYVLSSKFIVFHSLTRRLST